MIKENNTINNSSIVSSKLFLYINMILYILILISSLTPYITRRLPIVYYIMLLSIWGLTMFLTNPMFVFRPTKITLLTILWIAYLIITRIIGLGDKAIGNLFYYISFWFMLIGLEFITSLKKSSIQRRFLHLTYIILSVNIILNIFEMYNSPNMSKYITGGVISGIDSNVGTYSYAFMCGLVGIIYYWKSNQNLKGWFIKIIYFTMFLLSLYMVYLSASMIALISIIIGIVISFFIRITKNNIIKKTLFISSSLIVIMIIILLNQSIYNMMYNLFLNISNNDTKYRAISLLDAFFGNGEDVSFPLFSGRIPLYMYSISTFFKNPIIGIGMLHTNYRGIIGLHSQILDDMAYFGLIGIAFHIAIIRQYYIKYLKPFIFYYGELIYPYYIVIMLFLVFNPVITGTLSAGIMFFHIIPFVISSDKTNRLK